MAMDDTVATAPETLSDDTLIRRILDGDTALYEIIMRRYNTRLYRAVRAVLGRELEVEDVMQDAYILAYQHLSQFEGRSQFSTWLTRIAVREALARRHKNERSEEWDAMSENRREAIAAPRDATDPESNAAAAQWQGLLQHAIDALPEHYRTVVMLRDVEGMSTAEAAECLSITEDNVKARLSRAHRTLREQLFADASRSTKDAFPFHAVRCDRVVAGVFAGLERLRAAGEAR